MTSVTLCLSGRPFRRRAVLDPSRTACPGTRRDRKSTRLNSSHSQISYAVFCLKKKKHTIKLFHRYLVTSLVYIEANVLSSFIDSSLTVNLLHSLCNGTHSALLFCRH